MLAVDDCAGSQTQPTVRRVARELVETLRENVRIDLRVREGVRAQLLVLVKRMLRKHDYPPDRQETVMQTVLNQTELLTDERAVVQGVFAPNSPKMILTH